VNKKEEMLEMKKAGCDAIVTDYPKRAIELLK
jgi:glycerophosphoryl diester phosphodiesterase